MFEGMTPTQKRAALVSVRGDVAECVARGVLLFPTLGGALEGRLGVPLDEFCYEYMRAATQPHRRSRPLEPPPPSLPPSPE
jgi:hypothetical protein